jgi:RHS repeat-associated protein
MLGKICGVTLLALLVITPAARAQTGIYPFGSFDTVGVDTIDRGSLNVHIEIPVVNKPGRGVPFQYTLVYDGLVWTPAGTAGSQTWTPSVGFGLRGQFNEGAEGYISYFSNTTKCYSGGSFIWVTNYSNYVYHDQFGVSHPLAYAVNNCTEVTTGASTPAADGSGYIYNGLNLISRDGKTITVPLNNQSSSGNITDANGNYVSNNGNGTFTDTLGKTALTIAGSGTPSSPKTFTYSTPTGTQEVTVTYAAYTVQTAFGCSGVTEYNLAQDLPNTITLGDGSVYTFTYEKTPGGSSQVTGRVASITLPQGGVVTYTYTGANHGIVCADGTPTGLTRSGGVGRTYVRSAITSSSSQTTVTDGLNNNSIYNFVIFGSPEAFYETNRSVYQGSASGTPLLSRQTCYNQAAKPCTTTAVTAQITQLDTYSSLNGGGLSGSTQTYNTFGLLTGQTNYDFGTASARGTVLRKETWTYPTSGIANLVSVDSVVDGAGNSIGNTSYTYDETTGAGHAALVTTSVPQHNAVSGQRGNLTTLSQAFGTGGDVNIASAYEDTGNPVSTTTPSNSTTAYEGAAAYSYDTSTHTFAITATPATPSSGVSLPSSATNDPNSGVPLTTTDPNNKTVTYKSYDALLRPTEIDYPDGGKMTAGYTPNQAGIYRYMNASTHTNTQINLESYGRVNWVAVENASEYYWNNYCYDNNGNLQYAAYRFAAPNQNNLSCSGGGDSYTYDALGRVTKVTHADGLFVTYAYTGRATQVTDENGFSRVTQVDGLGRPTAVCEVSTYTFNGTLMPANCGLDITTASGYKTTYAYTTDTSAGNASKMVVTQGQGQPTMQTRTFETDWLGRTTSVVEPEAGTTTLSYSYSSSSGLGLTVVRTKPQANQTGSATTTTTTQYDTLGRVVSVTYSDGTPVKNFAYDSNTYWTQVGSNLKGRLAVTGTGAAGSSTWTGSSIGYDAMGRVINIWACGPATCGTSNQASRPESFAYDWAGNLTQENDGVSGSIDYGRSVAGEVTSITNQTYTNLPYNPPNLVSNVTNGPDGPVSYTLGNGLTVYRTYDSLGRPAGMWVCNGTPTMDCSGGTQIYGTAANWKGQLMTSQSDTVLNQGVTFGYGDSFNRLTARTVTAGTVQNYTYGFDLFGNRTSQTPLNGGLSFNPTINATNNRITLSGYTYDAAGNMTNDSVNAYTFDAEGNVTKVVNSGGTTQYVYDAFNHRVHVQTPSATTEFAYDYAGRRISSWLSPNNTGNEGRLYWDGQLLGYRAVDGTTYFEHQDILGTERMRTTYSGSVGSSYVSLPWGDGYAATVNASAADEDNNHFAGLQHDPESDTEHAQFRNYASVQGRWLAPDPYLGSYDFTNPQSFNRYTYALNDPVNLLDPSGLDTTQPVQCGVDDKGNPVYCITTTTGPGPTPPPCSIFPDGCSGIPPWACLEYGCGWPGIPPATGPSVGPDYGPLHLARTSAPSKGNQKIDNQISTVDNCTSQANAAMNAGPSVSPTAQNIIDGIVAATYTVATDGTATALSVLKSFFKGAAVRSAGHAAQDGLTFLTTYHGCLAAAGQGSPYNPYSPN